MLCRPGLLKLHVGLFVCLVSVVTQVSHPQGQCLASPQVPPPTYKQRSDEFKKLFKELQESERLIVGQLPGWSQHLTVAFYTLCAFKRRTEYPAASLLWVEWICISKNVSNLFPRLCVRPAERHSTARTALPVWELPLLLQQCVQGNKGENKQCRGCGM